VIIELIERLNTLLISLGIHRTTTSRSFPPCTLPGRRIRPDGLLNVRSTGDDEAYDSDCHRFIRSSALR
jgi:hypothetical protein